MFRAIECKTVVYSNVVYCPVKTIHHIVVTSLTLLKMGKRLPETCWADSKINKFLLLHLSLSNGSTAQGGPRPPSRVSSIFPGLGRLFSNFYTLALLHLPPLHLTSAAWVSIWGDFLLAHWGGLSWINLVVLPYDMSCPSQSTQLAKFHNVILTTQLVEFYCCI